MKLCIIGCGAVTHVVSKLIEDYDVIYVDKNPKFAKNFVDKKIKKVDALKCSLDFIKKCDIVINLASPRLNIRLMKAAMKYKVNYVDAASMLEGKKVEQLHFSNDFKRRGLFGLINIGVEPGLSNLLASEIYHKLNENAETIKTISLEEEDADVVFNSWSPKVAFDDFTSKPVIYRNGRYIYTKPLSEPERIKFPIYGERTVYTVSEEDPITIPKYLNSVENAETKCGGSKVEEIRTLLKYKLFPKFENEIIKSFPRSNTPKEITEFIENGLIRNAQFILGIKADEKMIWSVFPNQLEVHKRIPGATYISYATGVSIEAFLRMVEKFEMEKGVYSAENLNQKQRRFIMRRLKNKYKIKFKYK